MTPAPGSSGGETKHASTPSQKMSVNLTDGSLDNPRRFQLGMSECVETKTITTTTRLTRKFPQVFVDNPIPLESLDVKEYPLAMKPTPPEIADFSYRMPIEYTDTQDPGEALFVSNTLLSADEMMSLSCPSTNKSSPRSPHRTIIPRSHQKQNLHQTTWRRSPDPATTHYARHQKAIHGGLDRLARARLQTVHPPPRNHTLLLNALLATATP
jgi:F-box and WD-40 domain protein CDC4